jgi:hypothetical protein
MTAARTIWPRRDGVSGRLPAALADLRGPRSGVVVLPVHLTWYGAREFDVAEAESRLALYSILIGKGQRSDLVRYMNAGRLAQDWPVLAALLSRRTRRACERRLGLPAGR